MRGVPAKSKAIPLRSSEQVASVPKGCAKTTGVYRFKRTKDTLHFTLVKDACQERVKNVTLDWTKK